MSQKTSSERQLVSVAEAARIMSRFRRTGKASVQEFNEAWAVLSGSVKPRSQRAWEFTLRTPARKLMLNAARLARAEGMVGHASSLEVRLSELPKGSVYRVGRSRNGCSTAHVDVGPGAN